MFTWHHGTFLVYYGMHVLGCFLGLYIDFFPGSGSTSGVIWRGLVRAGALHFSFGVFVMQLIGIECRPVCADVFK